jgi:hypothetical protein
VDESLVLDFRNRWNLRTFWTEEFKRFEKDFRNRRAGAEVGYNTRAYQSIEFGVQAGRIRQRFPVVGIEGAAEITNALSTEYEAQRLRSTGSERSSTWIHILRANQAFTKDHPQSLRAERAQRSTARTSRPFLSIGAATVRDGAGRLSARHRGARPTLRPGPPCFSRRRRCSDPLMTQVAQGFNPARVRALSSRCRAVAVARARDNRRQP